jgi:hypothetical protein
MAGFRVGQRVRVVNVYLTKNLWMVGKEGVVTEMAEDDYGNVGYGLDFLPITWGVEGFQRVFYAFSSDQLEPLCKDDDQVGSWDALRDLGLDVDEVMGVVFVHAGVTR